MACDYVMCPYSVVIFQHMQGHRDCCTGTGSLRHVAQLLPDSNPAIKNLRVHLEKSLRQSHHGSVCAHRSTRVRKPHVHR